MLKWLKKGFGWFSKRQPVPKTAETIKICVIGPPGAGKTAIVEQFLAALADGSAPRMPIKLLFDPHQEAQDQDIVVQRGVLEFEGKVFRVELYDPRGDLLMGGKLPGPDEDVSEWPPIYQASWDCDLLVLALGPEVLDQPEPPKAVLNQLLLHVRGALQDNPEAMLAIAYTKADEYGVVDPESIRVIGDRKQISALERFQHSESTEVHSGWTAFLDVVAGPAESGDKGLEVRRALLEKTRHLWEACAYQLQHRFINGYFVAARPIDESFKPWGRRGILQLFADFFDHVQDTRARPRFGNWSAGLLMLLAIGVAVSGIVVFSKARAAVTNTRRVTSQYSADQTDWKQAASQDATSAYEAYLAKYPEGAYRGDADSRIGQLKRVAADDQAWEDALRASIISAFEKYLADFPNGRHVVEAREQIVRLKPPPPETVGEAYYVDLEKSWKLARQGNTSAAFRRFMESYPESVLTDAASVWIGKQSELRDWPHAPGENAALTEPWRRYVADAMEAKAWETAQSKNRIQGFREFRIGFPGGPRAEQAAQRIRELDAAAGRP